MADSQSPEEGVKRIMSENGETRPQKGSVVSFPFDNDHPTSAFVGQTGNTSRTLNIKPKERSMALTVKANAKTETPKNLNRQDGSGAKPSSECRFSHHIRNIDQGIPGPRDLRDRGSSSEVMYEHCFQNLRTKTKAKLKESKTPLVGFSGESRADDKTRESDEPIQALPISSKKDTHGNEEGKEKDELLEKSLENKPPEKVVVHDDHPDQTITIGGNLTAECRSGMTKILRKHADAFAWTPADMIGISCFVAEHELKTYPHVEPRVQRKRSIAPDKRKIVKDEVAEWFKAGIVIKVGRYYLRRANRKKSGSLRRRHGHQKQNRAGNDKRRPRDIINAQKGKHEVKSQKCSFGMEEEVEEAFQEMKKLIVELPTLTAIKKEKELMVYLSAANEAVSAVVLVERNRRQTSIHCISRTLQDAKINYPPMEKLALALVHAARRLRRYASRSTIKGQVLADFLADTTAEDSPAQAKTDGQDDTLTEGENPEEQEAAETKAPANLKAETNIWKLYTDGVSNDHGSKAGLILIDLDGAEYSYALRLKFANSNNDVEYKARLAEGLGIKLVSTSVYHPQANGAVERANQSIMQGIKTRLNQEGGAWVEELPNVLWVHRTTPKTSNGETPFSLAYGTEAVIPVEIGIPTRRTIQRSNKENMEALRLNLNLLEEGRKTVAIREAR
ncbi:reverse transcriptase domain-containing protein [Tanacetum coccineum]